MGRWDLEIEEIFYKRKDDDLDIVLATYNPEAPEAEEGRVVPGLHSNFQVNLEKLVRPHSKIK